MAESSYHWQNLVYAVGMGAGGMTAYRLPGFVFDYIGAAVVTAGVILIGVNGYVRAREADMGLKVMSIADSKQAEHDALAKQRAAVTQVDDDGFLSMLKVGGKPYIPQPAYSQTVAPVKIDHERKLARTLADMKRGGFPMNISETYWIREGHWQDGPESFRATRAKWEYYNIVGKRGNAANSRYEIMNERGVELIASGSLNLPPPPS